MALTQTQINALKPYQDLYRAFKQYPNDRVKVTISAICDKYFYTVLHGPKYIDTPNREIQVHKHFLIGNGDGYQWTGRPVVDEPISELFLHDYVIKI